ncbi:neprilysin-1-like [Dermacentor andersoni]|uniref:neprilysin-1-like n=1 Tax=Dermacentor andersoni TaxID=34620 RepID=UPI003B3A33C6
MSKRSKRRLTSHESDMQARKTIIEAADAELKNRNRILVVVGLVVVAFVATGAGLIYYFRPQATEGRRVAICHTRGCKLHGMVVSRAIDHNVDPCVDFYSYTCGKWQDTHESVIDSLMAESMKTLIEDLEEKGKRVTAAETFYDSCVNASKERDTNLQQFLQFKASLGLVWPEEQPTETLHPLDLMLDLAMRWDMNFFFDVSAIQSHGRSVLLISRSRLNTGWMKLISEPWTDAEYAKVVQQHLNVLNQSADVDISVQELRKIEEAILDIKSRSHLRDLSQEWFTASVLESKTPSVPSGMWLEMLAKHDEQFTWTANSTVIVDDVGILTSLEKLLSDHSRHKRTLMIGLSWVFIHTHLWAVVGEAELRFRSDVKWRMMEGCAHYVDSKLGVFSAHRILSEKFATVPGNVNSFLKRIKEKAKELVKNLTWPDQTVKEEVWLKMDHMTRIVLPPPEFFREKSERQLYASFTDAITKNFVANLVSTSVIRRRLRNNSRFADTYSMRFFPRYGLSRYLYLPNRLQIAAASLYPPLFYTEASLAILYGAWGSVAAREIMKVLDAKGIGVAHNGSEVKWVTGPSSSQSAAGYVEKTGCKLGTTTGPTDGEPVALIPAVTALELSYAAFRDAVSTDFRDLVDFRIPHLEDYNDEQVLFLTFCYVQCAKKPPKKGDECNVPARNFPHFAAAFNCKPDTPMNPANRCTLFDVARKLV